MSTRVGVMNFHSECQKLLHEYGVQARLELNEALPEAGKIAVKMIRANSKKATGRYAKGWAKMETTVRGIGTSVIVYNKDRYRVAHLLERSHVVRNKYGEYGSTQGDGVIKDAEEYTTAWLLDEVARRLGS